MLEQINVPDIGDYAGVAIISIAVKVGDQVQADAELITLETDKASMEIPAPKPGIVKELLVKVGDKVSKGSPILMLETTGSVSEAKPAVQQSNPQPSAPATTEEQTSERRAGTDRRVGLPDPRPEPVERRSGIDRRTGLPEIIYAGPGVRRFARELGVDLQNVRGTGRKNRILQTDVQAYVKQALQQLAQGSVASGGLNISPAPEVNFAQFGAIEKQPLSRIQKISGSFLHRNWVTIPHVTQFDSADITELEVFRQGQKHIAEQKGLKLTPIVFLLKAVVAAMQQYPKFNSSLAGEELVLKKYFHVGVAVDTPNGLVVPVIRNVDQKGLFELAEDLGTLSKKARDGKLTGADMQGGCFTISSLGGIGGTAFTPIINAPEVAILGVSRSQMQLVYNADLPGDDKFAPRLMLPLSLSYDHRVIDGADAARFTSFLVNLLADIRRLLL